MRWWLYLCSDCDTDGGVVIRYVPEGTNPERSSGIDFCLGCGSHLSYIQMGEVQVSGNALVHLRMRTPAEDEA
jgi:hypothetical protein